MNNINNYIFLLIRDDEMETGDSLTLNNSSPTKNMDLPSEPIVLLT